jgi:RND superfamily putative drug exporter
MPVAKGVFRMSKVLYRIGRACFAHRWLVVSLWLLVIVAGALGAKAAGGQLDDTFTIPGSQSQTALDQVQRDFPAAGGTSAQLIFHATDGTTLASPANAAAIKETLDRAATAPQVTAVISPRGSHLITPDDKTGIATVQYPVSADSLNSASLTALTGIGSTAGSKTMSVVAGGPAYSAKSSSSGSSVLIGLIIAFIVLAVALGSLLAAGLPLLTAIAGIVITMLGLRGLAAALSISHTAVTLAVMIGLAVGIDYALFILTRHRAQLAAGLAPAESAGLAAGTAGTAVAFAGCTVIIALAALAVVGIPFLTVMGLAAAGGVLVAVLIATTLLPAVFALAGRRLAPRPGSRAARLAGRAAHSADPRPGAKPTLGARWLAAVTRHPGRTLAAAVLMLLVLAVPALKLSLALPDNGYAAQGTPERVAFDTVSADFGPGFNGPLLILANPGRPASHTAAKRSADAVAARLKGFSGVKAVTAPQLDAQGTAALIQVVPTTAPSASATANLVTSIRNQASAIERGTGDSIAVTGTTAINVDVSAKLSAALAPFAAIVLGLSVLLLLLVFRSLLVPVTAALGFLLSVAASFGATVAVFQWGWLAGLIGVPATGPLASFLPIMLIAVLFGLAMDYEVFLVSRIREDYVRGGDPRRAIVAGGGASARVVVAAALIMTSIFASFVLPDDPIIKPIAFALAVGVACDALLVRMTIVPAVLALAGRGTWYLPRWLDRLLPNLDIEGAGLRRQPAAAARDSAGPAAGLWQDADGGPLEGTPHQPGPARRNLPR